MWFECIKNELSPSYQGAYKMALLRLDDIYQTGKILKEHETKHLKSYSILSVTLKIELEEFLVSLSTKLSPHTIDNYKHNCSRFLIYLQKRDITSIAKITYEVVLQFYDEDIHDSKLSKCALDGKVSIMLQFFYKKGILTYGYTRLFHYLSLEKGIFWNDIDSCTHDKIRATILREQTVQTEVLIQYLDALVKCLHHHGYSKSVILVNTRAIELLILFLEMHSYPYTNSIAMYWFEGCRHRFGREDYSIRRALLLIAEYHDTGRIDVFKVFRSVPRAFEQIPEWCQEAAYKYEKYKIQEGWDKSTLNMIRSALSRFCNYLGNIEVSSFKELNAIHIRQFNENDIHKSAAGKNAYNGRIRKFLIFLGEEGYITNPMLFAALSCTCAPYEPIVVILTEAEMEELNLEIYKEDSHLSLRKKAMLLLGLKMGLRASDIVNLKYDNIDWNQASVHFVQDKTDVELILPMPTEVGNALFQYIIHERENKETPSIFLSEKAPHGSIGRAACIKALQSALPERQVEGSGFHVTRKTYATTLLRNGVGTETVVNALGQIGTASVHRYLSLDSERMKLCALTLDGIGGWKYEN